MVQSAALWLPPSSFSTCLITIKVGAMSSLVTVQVQLSPGDRIPLQPSSKKGAYPAGPDSSTLNGPASRTTLVPASLPGKLDGLAFVPLTLIVQSLETLRP